MRSQSHGIEIVISKLILQVERKKTQIEELWTDSWESCLKDKSWPKFEKCEGDMYHFSIKTWLQNTKSPSVSSREYFNSAPSEPGTALSSHTQLAAVFLVLGAAPQRPAH